jgi:hypothetical protein
MTRKFRPLNLIAPLAFGIASVAFTAPSFAGASMAPGNMPQVDMTETPAALMASLSSRPAGSRLTANVSPALDFVRHTGVVKNLSLLLLHDVKNEAHVQAAIKRYGFDKVQKTVVTAIRMAQLEHGAEWGDMLAGIYDSRFDAGELKSILAEKESSPHFGKLIEAQDAIAAAVRHDGQDIYAEARAQVMRQLERALKI